MTMTQFERHAYAKTSDFYPIQRGDCVRWGDGKGKHQYEKDAARGISTHNLYLPTSREG